MSKRVWNWDTGWLKRNILGISTLMVFCLLTICIFQYMLTYQSPDIQTMQDFAKKEKPIEILNITSEIIKTLNEQRDDIRLEINNKNIMDILYNSSIHDIGQLVPENKGNPLRSILVTSWRSGSTFIGDVLDSLPGNYYHYEPLLDYEIIQIRGPPLEDEAFERIISLLNCNYYHLDRYLEYGRNHVWLFLHNKRLWEKCLKRPHICWLPEFVSPFCTLFPFQSAKIVRVRLSLFENLLDDQSLNIKILYLVRDPRGTLESRSHREWCPDNPDCWDPELLCADLVSDYSSSVRFTKKYPNRFRAIRYEDMASDVYNQIEDILKFFGFKMHPNVIQFLDTHTKENLGDVSSTFRDSKSIPFHWRKDLSFDDVSTIQKFCEPAMKLWGYLPVYNESYQKTFLPIVSNFRLP